jgi:hypothetical protein
VTEEGGDGYRNFILTKSIGLLGSDESKFRFP